MKKNKSPRIVLPALRGIMGDWIYYSCLMSLQEISGRVSYAEEIHKNKKLSDMIQRRLKSGRSAEIAKYLDTQTERFFNSLVIATYGGQPNWHALDSVKSRYDSSDIKTLSPETLGSVGFLTLRGDERLIALDGQHRLAGIKKAIGDGLKQNPFDELSVIFVAHKETAKGLGKTSSIAFQKPSAPSPTARSGAISSAERDAVIARLGTCPFPGAWIETAINASAPR